MSKLSMPTEPVKWPTGCAGDDEYNGFVARVQARLAKNVADGRPIFQTDATGLFTHYIAGFQREHRQSHNCRACEHFIERVGSLAIIGDNGKLRSAVFEVSDAPAHYVNSIDNVVTAIEESASIVSPFYSDELHWGKKRDGIWSHYNVKNPAPWVRADKTAGQGMAEKIQDRELVRRALREYPLDVVVKAKQIVDSNTLARTEKVAGVADWFHNLHKNMAAARGSVKKDLVLWQAVATAAPGWAHIGNTMIGTLLDDIKKGKPLEDIKAMFAAKMDPTKYLRPEAAPTQGAIVSAEKLVERLGIAASLVRRYAYMSDITDTRWSPRPAKAPRAASSGGVFANVQPKQDAERAVTRSAASPAPMTWAKFERDYLPNAVSIKFRTNAGARSYFGLTTAHDMDAPPILQWDTPERRIPVSSYMYHGGSTPAEWMVNGDVPVECIIANPAHWHGTRSSNSTDLVGFVLRGAYDRRRLQGREGSALFPETLKSELHGIRKVVEAHSENEGLRGDVSRQAAGVFYTGNTNGWNGCMLLVTDASGVETAITLDRFE